LADYDKVISLEPDCADAYNGRGMAHQGRGDYDRAIADYDKAIALNPSLTDARYNRGVARRQRGK
jgi:tetratricopeptide (TPR) repeat protein